MITKQSAVFTFKYHARVYGFIVQEYKVLSQKQDWFKICTYSVSVKCGRGKRLHFDQVSSIYIILFSCVKHLRENVRNKPSTFLYLCAEAS